MNRIPSLAFLAALSLALSACGNKGPLVRPAPTPAPQAEPAPAPVEQPTDLPPPPAPDATPPAGDGNG